MAKGVGRPPLSDVPNARTPPNGLISLAKKGAQWWKIPPPARERISWLRTASVARDIVFWLREPGVAECRLAHPHINDLNSLLDGEDPAVAAEDVQLVIHRGRFDPSDRMTIPIEAIIHVTGIHVLGEAEPTTPFWIWTQQDSLELWSESVRQAAIRDANERIARERALFKS